MAPELALAAMEGLKEGQTVLDPMAGSGTVLRNAALSGFRSIGFDTDPLAVLISRASTFQADSERVRSLTEEIAETAQDSRLSEAGLPWIDNSEDTQSFIRYWFARKQRNDLRKLAFAIHRSSQGLRGPAKRSLDLIKIALSRIIITKEAGASLARDVSHSRPHKVRESNDFDVFAGFKRSACQVIKFLENAPIKCNGTATRGDARDLSRVADRSVDLVVTSPPYLNAIDYLRGHRLSLVWLGYGTEELRRIRSENIGSERKHGAGLEEVAREVQAAMIGGEDLSSRNAGLVARFAHDMDRVVGEIARVLNPGGEAILVVGDCNVQSKFVSNSRGVAKAAEHHNLRLKSHSVRDLPLGSRYLPISASGSLSKRMRTENVMRFAFA
jgi:hypothetical protein